MCYPDLSTNAHALRCLCTACEHAKHTLSSATQTSIELIPYLRISISIPPSPVRDSKSSARTFSVALWSLSKKSCATRKLTRRMCMKSCWLGDPLVFLASSSWCQTSSTARSQMRASVLMRQLPTEPLSRRPSFLAIHRKRPRIYSFLMLRHCPLGKCRS